ncbi:MAG TPA: VacJ family lipoprotein [Myxococcota bacterium]|jgi:phospholipid-binding lipoprotein MlaA|nr:VacJ family lipoprotein [Myxococcota bacterium]
MTSRSGLALALAIGLSALGGCASAGAREDRYWDPWEPMNRGIFRFNDTLDDWVLEPAARGWDYVVPDRAEVAIHDFFENLRFPVVFANDLLQCKLEWAIMETFRFAVNSTVGVAGFLDPATSLGLIRRSEDFGQTLAAYGVPGGPFLMLPFLGPSNPRDTVGLAADSAVPGTGFFVSIPLAANVSLRAVNVVNQRARFLDEIEEAKRSSVDYYVFVRNGYLDYRENQINDGQPGDETFREELYDVDEGDGN